MAPSLRASRRAGFALEAALLLAAAACTLESGLWGFTPPSAGEAPRPSRQLGASPAAAQPRAAPREAGASLREQAVAGSAVWAAASVACAFAVGMLAATQPVNAWTRLGIAPTNITSFDKFVDRLEKQFVPLQKALSGAQESVEEKKEEVANIEQAQAVLYKLETREKAVMESKPAVPDPFANDSVSTLKKEEKAVQVLEQVVEEMKQQATDPAEKKALDTIERQAEKAEAQIVKDEAKDEAKAPAPEPKQEAKEAQKEEVQKAPAPTPAAAAKLEVKDSSKEAPPKEEEAKPAPPTETPKEAATILKEEEKVMEALEDKKKAAQEAQKIAEAKVEQIKEEIAAETKIEEAELKKVKEDIIKAAKKEAAESEETVKEAAMKLEKSAEAQLEKVKEEIVAEAKRDGVSADKDAMMKVEKKAEAQLNEIKGDFASMFSD